MKFSLPSSLLKFRIREALAKLSNKVGSNIQHATLLDVNVEVVAKHYPTLLDGTDSSSSWRKN